LRAWLLRQKGPEIETIDGPCDPETGGVLLRPILAGCTNNYGGYMCPMPTPYADPYRINQLSYEPVNQVTTQFIPPISPAAVYSYSMNPYPNYGLISYPVPPYPHYGLPSFPLSQVVHSSHSSMASSISTASSACISHEMPSLPPTPTRYGQSHTMGPNRSQSTGLSQHPKALKVSARSKSLSKGSPTSTSDSRPKQIPEESSQGSNGEKGKEPESLAIIDRG